MWLLKVCGLLLHRKWQLYSDWIHSSYYSLLSLVWTSWKVGKLVAFSPLFSFFSHRKIIQANQNACENVHTAHSGELESKVSCSGPQQSTNRNKVENKSVSGSTRLNNAGLKTPYANSSCCPTWRESFKPFRAALKAWRGWVFNILNIDFQWNIPLKQVFSMLTCSLVWASGILTPLLLSTGAGVQ